MSYYVPIVLENTGRGERSMDIYSRLLKDRIVFIGTPIDDNVANVVIAQMLFLQMEDANGTRHAEPGLSLRRRPSGTSRVK